MAQPVICKNCEEVLEPTSKDYQVCGNCGEFNWIGAENKVEVEPNYREKLQIARERLQIDRKIPKDRFNRDIGKVLFPKPPKRKKEK
jgi:hypothetical protein